jgi:hypothetical protein
MRAAWLAIGLAVAVPAGVVLFTRKRAASVPAAAVSPGTEAALTPALNATLKSWLDALDIDHLGQAEHKTPTAETIGGASLFANQLQAAGYPVEADALRTAISLSSGGAPATLAALPQPQPPRTGEPIIVRGKSIGSPIPLGAQS